MKDPWYGNLVVEDMSHKDLQARVKELFVPDVDMREEVVEQCHLHFEGK